MTDATAGPDADKAFDDLLEQLHRLPKAEPQPFFYARVQGRLAAAALPRQEALVPAWLRRPAYAVLLGALVLGLSSDGTTGRAQTEAGRPGYSPQLPR